MAEKVTASNKENTQKRKPIRGFFRSFVDVKKWFSYDEVKTHTGVTWGLFKRLLSRSTDVRVETYDEAVKRLNLTPEQLVKRQRSFLGRVS